MQQAFQIYSYELLRKQVLKDVFLYELGGRALLKLSVGDLMYCDDKIFKVLSIMSYGIQHDTIDAVLSCSLIISCSERASFEKWQELFM